MKKILLIIFKYILAFSIAILLLWWSLKNLTAQQLNEIKDALLRAEHWLAVPVCGVLLLSHYFRALRWQQLIKPMGYQPRSFHLLCGILIGYIGNQLIPRAGEILRCTSISNVTKTPAEKLIGTIVAERAFDIVCLFFITAGIIYFEYDVIAPYAREIGDAIKKGVQTKGSKVWLIVIIIALALIIFLLTRKFKTHRFGVFIIKMLTGLWQGLTSIGRVKNKFLFIFYSLCIWICYAGATYIGCFALAETEHLAVSAAVAMLVFGTFGIIVAPGGLGAYPVAIQKTLVLYNIPQVIGLASGWLLWIVQFIFTIIFGSLAYIAIRIANREQDEERIVHP